jgi:enolase-phosphatase E1
MVPLALLEPGLVASARPRPDAALAAVLLDIEGTVAPIRFVHEVLFPYARRHLAEFLKTHRDEPAMAEALCQLAAIAPGAPAFETLEALMDRDAKLTPLKTIQGMIWAQGYGRGELRTTLYPDVIPLLRHWHDAGLDVFVYSSASEAAQRLLFRHTGEGDLTPLFSGFFDTRHGAKREAASYAALGKVIGWESGMILFLSDSEAELDAANEAGLVTCQIVRDQDGTRASRRHATAANLWEASMRHGLPL